MTLQDLQNLIFLARKGLASIADNLPSQEGQLAYQSIGTAEAFVAQMAEQEKKKKELEASKQTEMLSAPNVEVITITQDGK
jgi:hypothetical protein